MPEQSRLLPNLYNSPDETVSEVGSRPLPPRETIRRRPGPAGAKFSAVTRVVIDQALMDYALNEADGDPTRLTLRPDGSVIVANSREQARRALRDPAFGTVNQPEQLNPPEEPAP